MKHNKELLNRIRSIVKQSNPNCSETRLTELVSDILYTVESFDVECESDGETIEV